MRACTIVAVLALALVASQVAAQDSGDVTAQTYLFRKIGVSPDQAPQNGQFNVPFGPRADASAVYFRDSVYLIAGTNTNNALNDVWKGTPAGIFTDQNAVTDNAAFSARYGQSVVVVLPQPGAQANTNGFMILSGGSSYIANGAADGGEISDPNNEVYRSADGLTWTSIATGNRWSARTAHQVVSFAANPVNGAVPATLQNNGVPLNILLLIGGLDAQFNGLADVWRSADNGASWTLLTTTQGRTAQQIAAGVTAANNDNPNGIVDVNSPATGSVNFTPRSNFGASVYRGLNGNTVVVTGGYNPAGVVTSQLNDVWTDTGSNGATWTQINVQSPNFFTPRYSHQQYTACGVLYVLAGGQQINNPNYNVNLPSDDPFNAPFQPTNVVLQDVYSSLDGGNNWNLLNSRAVDRRQAFALTVTNRDNSGNQNVLVIDGYALPTQDDAGNPIDGVYYNDVWLGTATCTDTPVQPTATYSYRCTGQADFNSVCQYNGQAGVQCGFGSGLQTQSVSCVDQNGQMVNSNLCAGVQQLFCQPISCSFTACATITYSYQCAQTNFNQVCQSYDGFTTCGGQGFYPSSTVCVDNNGNQVNDFNCNGQFNNNFNCPQTPCTLPACVAPVQQSFWQCTGGFTGCQSTNFNNNNNVGQLVCDPVTGACAFVNGNGGFNTGNANCGTGVSTQQAVCIDQFGQNTPGACFDVAPQCPTQPCSLGACASFTCGSCANGATFQQAICIDQNGQTVDSSVCQQQGLSAPQCQSCTSYSWQCGSLGACVSNNGQNCGTGYATPQSICVDNTGLNVAAGLCTGQAPTCPQSSCNLGPCTSCTWVQPPFVTCPRCVAVAQTQTRVISCQDNQGNPTAESCCLSSTTGAGAGPRPSATRVCPVSLGQGCVTADPEFIGFLGQKYEIHGVPNQVFNIITSPLVQYNAEFVFLGAKSDYAAQCNATRTHPWTHAGTYLGRLGFMTVNGDKIEAQAGSCLAGIKSLIVNGEQMTVGQTTPLSMAAGQAQSITFVNEYTIKLVLAEVELTLTNSDKFFNQEVAMTAFAEQELADLNLHMHGLLGQTWSPVTHVTNGVRRVIEGTSADYMIQDEDLFGSDFSFNQF